MTNEQVWYMLQTQLDSFSEILQEVTEKLLLENPEIKTKEYSSVFMGIIESKDIYIYIALFEKLYKFLSIEQERLNKLLGDKK